MKNKAIYVFLIILIIAGAIVYKVKGLNKELNYSNRQQFEISAASTFDVSKVETIAKEVLSNRNVKVQKVERFNNALEIISTEISEDEKQNIINKVNEEYNETISNDNISIISIPETRVKDILMPYILPIIITLTAVLLYFVLVYSKLGLKSVIFKGIAMPVLILLSYYSIIVILRIPFGRITNCIAVALYLLSIGTLAVCFQNKKEELIINIKNEDEKENDE